MMKNPDSITKRLVADLNTAYLNKKLIVFIGAGISMPVGIPGWKTLIEDIYSHYKTTFPNSIDNFWNLLDSLVEEGVQEELIKNYIAQMIREYMEQNKDIILDEKRSNYSDLDKPYLKKIFSTNFDIIPERLIQNTESRNLLALGGSPLGEVLSSDRKSIIYMHGNVNQPETIVVTSNDVKKIYNSEQWKNTFISALSTYHVLFMGISFADEYMRMFSTNILHNSGNNYSVITFRQINEIPLEKQIILENAIDDSQRVIKIREILNSVFIDFSETVFLKIPQGMDTKAVFNKIGNNFQIRAFRESESIAGDKYKTMQFSIYGNDYSVEKTFNLLNESISKCYFYEKNQQPIIFISQSRDNILVPTHGRANIKYFEKIHDLLCACNDQKEISFMLDTPNKHAKSDSDHNFFATMIEKRFEVSLGKHSVLTSTNFEGGTITGIEVHVAGAVILNNKLFVEIRNAKEANIPNMCSLPGGRVHRDEMFSDSIKRKIHEVANLRGDNYILVCEYLVIGSKSPGVFFEVLTDSLEIMDDSRFRFVDRSDLLALKNCGSLALDKSIFDYILSRLKPSIKIRIVMLSDCNYNCELCHHENLTKRENYNFNQIKTTILKLQNDFVITKITITGGEPLLPNNFINLVELLSFIRLHFPKTNISIITNAYYLNQNVIEKLKSYDVKFKLSLYGFDDTKVSQYVKCSTEKIVHNYFTHFIEKLVMLGENNIETTINLPIHKSIAEDFLKIFSEKKFLLCIKEYGIKIKIIEMVKSFDVDQKSFDKNFTSIFEIQKKLDNSCVDFVHFNLSEIIVNGTKVTLYQYPCNDLKNCLSCFSEFALTIKPTGELLICNRAKEHALIRDSLFSKYIIEYTDYKLVYNL